MKATDLMVGDLVQYTDPIHDGEPMCITGMWRVHAKDGDTYMVQSDDAEVSINNIAPIPLTSDILNKNYPDVRHGISWCWDDTKSIDNETWYEVRTLDIEGIELCISIRYVHELQHVLRLCGVEKEIVL